MPNHCRIVFQCVGTTRSWYGKSFFPPGDAIVDTAVGLSYSQYKSIEYEKIQQPRVTKLDIENQRVYLPVGHGYGYDIMIASSPGSSSFIGSARQRTLFRESSPTCASGRVYCGAQCMLVPEDGCGGMTAACVHASSEHRVDPAFPCGASCKLVCPSSSITSAAADVPKEYTVIDTANKLALRRQRQRAADMTMNMTTNTPTSTPASSPVSSVNGAPMNMPMSSPSGTSTSMPSSSSMNMPMGPTTSAPTSSMNMPMGPTASGSTASPSSPLSTYCTGSGLAMNMIGFQTSVDDSSVCLNFLFPTWTLDSAMKLAFGWLGTFSMGIFMQYLMFYRDRVKSSQELEATFGRYASLVGTFLFGIQTVIGYFVMLITMTYSAELFSAVCVGLMVGYHIFVVQAMAKNVDKEQVDSKAALVESSNTAPAGNNESWGLTPSPTQPITIDATKAGCVESTDKSTETSSKSPKASHSFLTRSFTSQSACTESRTSSTIPKADLSLGLL